MSTGPLRVSFAFLAVVLKATVQMDSATAAPCPTIGFRYAPTVPVGFSPVSVTIGDFNGDGKLDLAVGELGPGEQWSGAFLVLLGNGDGTFQPGATYLAAGQSWSGVGADFNRDGKLDLILVNGGGVAEFLGNGDGTFQAATTVSAGVIDPYAIAVGDFNGDGKADLAVADFGLYDPTTGEFSGSNVAVLLGNGDGTFQAAGNYATGSRPYGIAVADLNGDGKQDLVTANSGSDNVSVFLGYGMVASWKRTPTTRETARTLWRWVTSMGTAHQTWWSPTRTRALFRCF